MNKVELVGRLTKDPDVRTATNTTVARFSVAVDRRYQKEGEQTADFPSCVAFGKTAEFIEKYFTKGMRIGLVGRIQTGSYKNRDGQTVYTTDVIVDEVEFVEKKNSQTSSDSNANANNASIDEGFMDLPDDEDENLPFN